MLFFQFKFLFVTSVRLPRTHYFLDFLVSRLLDLVNAFNQVRFPLHVVLPRLDEHDGYLVLHVNTLTVAIVVTKASTYFFVDAEFGEVEIGGPDAVMIVGGVIL